MNTQKHNWWLDATLFLGFFISFLMNVTGVELHQWIGVLVGLGILIHLYRHLDWVAMVSTRFFGKTSNSARVNLMLDAVLLVGFSLILFTGLIISTWLNLTFINYTAWWTIHVVSSIMSMFALVFKLYLHRKWIVNVAETHVFARKPAQAPAVVPAMVEKRVNRREFLKMSAVLGAGAFVGAAQIHNVLEAVSASGNTAAAASAEGGSIASVAAPAEQNVSYAATQPAAVSTAVPTSAPTRAAAAAPSASVNTGSQSSCTVRCPRGCSYPGHCRRYTDPNGNGKCDLGECL